jgi:hypothetical protein
MGMKISNFKFAARGVNLLQRARENLLKPEPASITSIPEKATADSSIALIDSPLQPLRLHYTGGQGSWSPTPSTGTKRKG